MLRVRVASARNGSQTSCHAELLGNQVRQESSHPNCLSAYGLTTTANVCFGWKADTRLVAGMDRKRRIGAKLAGRLTTILSITVNLFWS